MVHAQHTIEGRPSGSDLLTTIALLDQVEARLTMAAVAARDMGLDLATLVGAAGIGGTLPTVASIRTVADDVRAAVARGDLRYVAAVGRAGS